eukprot:TRINITY_DN11854_c0_g1_i4.p1 TRINITY_DN11854_c0_g1~~TRINITY_DN11854_c0_g1_i4.p1  ORF type:complete len:129 (+),score=24.70 TRINITY_DN11854_c0_g1_i4:276-662(+)
MEELSMDGITFKAYDLGGNVKERPLWEKYFPLVDAVVFVVDIADVQRMKEARDTLYQLFITEHLNTTPFLIFGNKIDLETACPLPKVLNELDLNIQHSRPLHVCMASFAKKQGIREGFQWLGTILKNR